MTYFKKYNLYIIHEEGENSTDRAISARIMWHIWIQMWLKSWRHVREAV